MFKQKTTVIIGAGASCELGLPSGEELKTRILDLLSPTEDNMYGFLNDAMVSTLRHRITPNEIGMIPGATQSVQDAARRIRHGLPFASSIDNFLHAHQEDGDVVILGKIAIAICILQAERESVIIPGSSCQSNHEDNGATENIAGSQHGISHTWYKPFVETLLSGFQRHEVANVFDNISFIIFNYDRCLEQHLFCALQAYFNIAAQEAAAILSRAEFLHPYGSLGCLPWHVEMDASVLPFGASGLNAWEVSHEIRTFTESLSEEYLLPIRKAVSSAHTIIILGFGYLDQNVQLLKPGGQPGAMRVFSTAYGLSATDQDAVRLVTKQLCSPNAAPAFVDPGSCRDLFEHHRLQLSLP